MRKPKHPPEYYEQSFRDAVAAHQRFMSNVLTINGKPIAEISKGEKLPRHSR